MKLIFEFTGTWIRLLGCSMVAVAVLMALPLPAGAADPATDDNEGASETAGKGASTQSGVGEDPEDPSNLLPGIRERRAQKDSLFRRSPLHAVHEATGRWKQSLYESTGLELGFGFNQLFQGVSESLPGADDWGTASTVDLVGTWELLNRGKPTQGQLFFGVQGRWDWGTTGPENLGTEALGSLSRPGNTFAAYSPAFLPLRNLYWQQGSKEAGWIYRIGKITPDAILSTSAHIAGPLTYTSTAGVGSFANALPDSGLGVVINWYLSDRVKLLTLVSDSNADRQDWGHISEGDLYKAVELGVKISPRTEKAGWSKLAVWHNDGTRDGSASNGNLGPDGWGFFLKLEQELSADGRVIGIAKYGRSYDNSALYRSQANLLFLYYDPNFIGHIQNDLVGIAFNYVEPSLAGSRGEYNPEIFYRFPLFPHVDMTLTYHSIINPSLDRANDSASAYSLRLRSTF
jgi:hypothetical protein